MCFKLPPKLPPYLPAHLSYITNFLPYPPSNVFHAFLNPDGN
jgi:hypothetical protein